MSTSPLGTRSLKLLVDDVERNADVSNCTIETAKADSDFTSFADAAAGGAIDWLLKFTATQDPGDADSIWSLLWDHVGETIPVVVNPYGVATMSATNPAMSGSVVVTFPEGVVLGGEANASTTARFTIELEWKFTDKPTKTITGEYGTGG